MSRNPSLPEAIRDRLESLDHCTYHDRDRLRRRLRGLRRGAGAAQVEGYLADLETAVKRAAARRARLPAVRYPEELPVAARRDEIAAALTAHQVVIVAGETGSGKTTQLPKLCLELGRGVLGQVAHTQPRRIAARSVAARIAEELGCELGTLVGYKVRFQERGNPNVLLKVMTDGILLNELQSDPQLLRYDTLIIDEAHERSLNIDFLLGYLKQLLPRRPELKLIVTSATIDTARFADHFAGAPVIEVSGRTWPVEVRYRPLAGDDSDRDQTQGILDAVDELSAIDRRGDILVFLPGERDIRETAEALRKHHPPHTEVLPLYARLSAADQNRIFHPGRGRRIVLATNVAETSLTVPGIRYVVDSGVARISRYNPRSKIQRLPIEPVSQASANQRKGRCGRVAAGVCIRLYDEADFLSRPEFTEPEILRTSLAAVILQMEAYRLGRIESFPFLEPPDPRMVRDGYQELTELGALDEGRQLTPLGKRLARLPVDPRIGRMTLAGAEGGCLTEVLVIAAALSTQDPRERPHDASAAADAAHAAYAVPGSDFLGYLKLWAAYIEQRRHLTQNKLRKWCRANFLSYLRLREWRETHQQLEHLVRDMGLHPNAAPAGADDVHRALLSGLLSQVAQRDEERGFTGVRGRKLHIFPGSGLHKRPPPWIMAAEVVETRRVYARTVAGVRPEWIEQLAGDLVRHRYLEPHWTRKRGMVVAFEQVSLYGLVLIQKRRVNYGPIDPPIARELFIRAALIGGDFATRAPFFAHNRALVTEIEALEARSRRRDLLVDDEILFRFYDERIPASVFDGKSFEAWHRDTERQQPQRLYMTRETLLRANVDPGLVEAYPESLATHRLPLDYRFDPQHALDGVTLTVPLAALGQLPPARLEWLVPGLLREKVVLMLRGLPKALRRQLVPIPDTADACMRSLEPDGRPLTLALAAELLRHAGVQVPPDALAAAELPPHLRMHVRVVGDDGAELAVSDDLEALQRRLATRTRASLTKAADDRWRRSGLTDWSCGPLPESVEIERAGVAMTAYPALIDAGEAAGVDLFPSAAEAAHAHRAGLRRLFTLRLGKELRYLQKNLPGMRESCLHFAPLGSCQELVEDITLAVVDRLFAAAQIRDAAAFEARLEAGRGQLVEVANELSLQVAAALAAYNAASRRLDTGRGAAAEEVRDQLARLIYPGFVAATPIARMRRLQRYLRAAELRLERLAQDPYRDAERAAQVQPWWHRYTARVAAGADGVDSELEEFRWMIEEFRISLFAQELRTAQPISARRLERQWEKVGGRT